MVATQLRPGPGPGAEPAERDFLTYDQFGNLITINFNTLATRQKIRGFSALQPDDPHSPMTSGQPYSTAPEQGDPVTFAVQVHNYSLVDSPSVPVEFFAVPVDHGDIAVTGPPQPMGTVSSAPSPRRAPSPSSPRHGRPWRRGKSNSTGGSSPSSTVTTPMRSIPGRTGRAARRKRSRTSRPGAPSSTARWSTR